LFAVARLAERHRVRVRLRPAPPQGLSALVWLPDSVIERTHRRGPGTRRRGSQPAGARSRTVAGEAVALATGGHDSLSGGSGGQTTLTGTRPGSGGGYSTGTGIGTGNGNGNPALEGRSA